MHLLVHVVKWLNLAPVPYLDILPPLCRARAVLEANELGVFRALASQRWGLTCPELASQVGISQEAASVLLMALAKTGYLSSRHARYQNGRWVRRWLLDGPDSMASLVPLFGYAWDRLGTLRSRLTETGPSETASRIDHDIPPEVQRAYVAGMRRAAHQLLPGFLRNVRLPSDARRLLDLGGSHGLYSHALTSRHPELQATVLDLPGISEVAQDLYTETGQPSNVQFKPGNALEDDLGVGWDVVLVINVMHLYDEPTNRQLLTRIYAALKPGGLLVLMDQFLGLGRTADSLAALMSLNYFTVGGRCYEIQTVEAMLSDIGCDQVRTKTVRFRAPSAVIQAVKPA